MVYVPTSVQWAPTVADIGDMLSQRTLDINGVATGTFSPSTHPTDVQVGRLVTDIAGEIVGECGTIPLPLEPDAHQVAIIGTAANVEAGFFSDSSSAFGTLLASRYDAALKRLSAAAARFNADGAVTPSGAPAKPSYSGSPQIGPYLGMYPTNYTGLASQW